MKQGECIAITGASGCGKTTLSKLLLGLYPLNGGTIKVNGMDFRDCCLGDLRKQIAYVPQEPYLFNGSILDNIRMGRPLAIEDEIRPASENCDCSCYFKGLTNSLLSLIGLFLSFWRLSKCKRSIMMKGQRKYM